MAFRDIEFQRGFTCTVNISVWIIQCTLKDYHKETYVGSTFKNYVHSIRIKIFFICSS